MKLDEGLSYLEGENPRRARDEVQIVKRYGSVANFVREGLKVRREAPVIS